MKWGHRARERVGGTVCRFSHITKKKGGGGQKAEPLHYYVFCPDRKCSIFIYLSISPQPCPPLPPPVQAKFLNQQILGSGMVKSYWGTDSDSITTIHGAIFCGESLSSTWLSPALHITSEWHALSLGKKWEVFFKSWDFNNMRRKDEITFWGGKRQEGGERERRWRASSWFFMEFLNMASFVVVKAAQVPFFVCLLTLSPGEGGWEKPCIALHRKTHGDASYLSYWELPALQTAPTSAPVHHWAIPLCSHLCQRCVRLCQCCQGELLW